MPLADQVEALNAIKKILHDAGPFKDEPVDCVEWVSSSNVTPNDYNPNAVAPPEMRLLEHSIRHDGYTQPVVVAKENDGFVVVDGFHRTRVGKECTAVRERVKGYLPVVRIRNEEMKDRMAATIRHNRARGVHGVSPMIDLVAGLIRRGWTDIEISKELGMSADEVLRYKQHAGLPQLFKGSQYSKAWIVKENEE
jgi:ParB-like chromosome segregation protein Spo0J